MFNKINNIIILSFFQIIFVSSDYLYETKWFTVPLDHFTFARNHNFELKYLVNDTYWNKGSGPILFYPGNEAPIELFAKQTGFIWEIASEFKAKVVFAEHRYYGDTMPFGNNSLDNENLKFLSASQALADYAQLIDYLRGNTLKSKNPVIAIGGSYAGMLATYLRIKYPHLVQGAIAASAPLRHFTGMLNCKDHFSKVTSVFELTNPICVKNIRRSWPIIRKFTEDPEKNTWLQNEWNLCEPVESSSDRDALIHHIKMAYQTISMMNYPYPSDFMAVLPGHPVKYICELIDDINLSNEALLEGIGKQLKIYNNSTKNNKCIDYKHEDKAWLYQTCTELVFPRCTTGKTDMFEPKEWDFCKVYSECKEKYDATPYAELMRVEYGGDKLQATSNIVLSNGLLDPWIVGGILHDINKSVIAILIPEAAHHLDLMGSRPEDPVSVISARSTLKENIRNWIKEFHMY